MLALAGPHRGERVLRRGRVRPRHLPPHADLELEHEGNKRARQVLKITGDPPRFISAMQLGVTISSLAIGALGEQVLAHKFDAVMASFLAVILALLIVTYLHVVIGELVPKGIALGHPERTALAVSTPVRCLLHHLRGRSSGCCRSRRVPPARARAPAARRRARGALGGRAPHAPLVVRRAGRDRARGAGDALQGLRLRRQGGLGRDGAAARGGRDLDRAAGGGGAEGRARVAVHALSRSTASRSTTSSASCTSAT